MCSDSILKSFCVERLENWAIPCLELPVINAGISGLMCARTLADDGFPLTVFGKSRGVGGRMATRRTDDGLRFDHGAPYFMARDHYFRRCVQSWVHDGIVEPRLGRIVVLENGPIKGHKAGGERFGAVPGMNALCKHLSVGLDISLKARVAPPQRHKQQWRVTSHGGTPAGNFDVIIVSASARQTSELLSAVPALADLAGMAAAGRVMGLLKNVKVLK